MFECKEFRKYNKDNERILDKAKGSAVENIQKEKEIKQKKGKKEDITFRVNKKGRHVVPLLDFLRCVVPPIYYPLMPYRFFGNTKIKGGAAIFVSNHFSIFDIIFPGVLTWDGVHYISKKENADVPVLGAVMRKVKSILANRDGSDVRVLLDSLKCLKNGDKIVIYPEGTRNKTNQPMMEFHHGAALMAIKAKAPIIPIVIYKKPRFFHVTHVIVGDPMELTEYYDKKLSEQELIDADNKIRDRMLELHRQHTEFLQSKKQKQ